MKIAFLILAHQWPAQLCRLVHVLHHADADCWIHIDAQTPMTDFESVFSLPWVYPVPDRVRAPWGTYGMVQSMNNALKSALESNKGYAYFQFLSGTDYLLQPVDHFIGHLEKGKSLIYIGNRPIEEATENMMRFYRFHFPYMPFFWRHLAEGITNQILPRRTFPGNVSIRKGSQWMALPRDAVEFVVGFMNKRSAFSRYFRFVHAPDEFYYHTLLFNSSFRPRMVNGIHHYIDWSAGGANPRFLNISDAEKLRSSQLFFARKFDLTKDSGVLDYIDDFRRAKGDRD